MYKKISLIFAAALMLSATACNVSDASDITETATEEVSAVESIEAGTTSQSAQATVATSVVTESAADNGDSVPVEAIPDVWNPAVVQRQVMLDNGCLCGVAYIGFVDGEATKDECRSVFYNSPYSDDFEYIIDIPDENVIDTGYANELYLIIPQEIDVTVCVNEWSFAEDNDFMGAEGQTFYRSETGAPVLLKCNFSDIMPNTVVNIVDKSGSSLSWSPSLSLKDGSVSRYGVEDLVYDFTHYIYNETYECYQTE